MAGEELYAGSEAVVEAGPREGYGGDAGLPSIPSRASSPNAERLVASQG